MDVFTGPDQVQAKPCQATCGLEVMEIYGQGNLVALAQYRLEKLLFFPDLCSQDFVEQHNNRSTAHTAI